MQNPIILIYSYEFMWNYKNHFGDLRKCENSKNALFRIFGMYSTGRSVIS